MKHSFESLSAIQVIITENSVKFEGYKEEIRSFYRSVIELTEQNLQLPSDSNRFSVVNSFLIRNQFHGKDFFRKTNPANWIIATSSDCTNH